MPVVQANGITISYHVQGDGEPLLLHMGIGQQWVIWPPDLLDALEQVGFQVIVYDHRDVGHSSHMDALGAPKVLPVLMGALTKRKVQAPYSLWDMADDAAGLLDALGIPSAHTMGISMGGMVAQSLAIRHPDRVLSLCSMMSTTGSRRYAIGKPSVLRGLLRKVPENEDAAIEHVLRIYSSMAGSRYAPDLQVTRERFQLAAQRGYTPQGFLRHLAAILTSGSRRHLLEQLDLPCLVLHGCDDPLIPLAGGRATAQAIPNARFMEIEGMGHDLPHELYGDLAKEVARIASVAASN